MISTLNLAFDLDSQESQRAIQAFVEFHSSCQSFLVQVFSGILEKAEIEKCLSNLRTLLPANAVIIGCTTGGEILNESMLDNRFVVSIVGFEKTQLVLKTSLMTESPRQLGFDLGKKLDPFNSKAVIMFMDGLSVNGEAVLNGLSESMTSRPVLAGGMAGDNMAFQQTWLIAQEQVFDQGAVAVALIGECLQVNNHFNLSWGSIGPKMKVTKVDGSRLFELNDVPVFEVYRQFLGEDFIQNFRENSVHFPLVIQHGSSPIARRIVDVLEDGSIVYAGSFKLGDEVCFGVANPGRLESTTQQMINALQTLPVETCFVYSCVGRKSYWKKQLGLEFSTLKTLAPVVGFFTYGEVYSDYVNTLTQDASESYANLLNITTTVLTLAEQEQVLAKHANSDVLSTYNKTPQEEFVDYLLHFVIEISRRLEAQLLEGNLTNKLLDQFQQAINKTFIVSRSDLDGNIVDVNDNFVNISGFSRQELIGKNHNIVRHPDSPKEMFSEMWQTIQAKRTWHGILKNRTRDGGYYIVKTTIIPILDLDENVVQYLSLREDVTRMVEQQTLLEEEQGLIRTLFDNQKSLVILTNTSSKKIEKANQAFLAFIGKEQLSDFLKKHDCICDLFVPEDGYLQKRMGTLSWTDYVLQNPENEHRAKIFDQYGKEHVFSVQISKILQQEERLIANFTDVTELEVERQRAIRAEKAQANFLASMSHELRTPINGILGFANLLGDTSLNKEQSRFVDVLIHSSERLLAVVNDILDFSKIEQGELKVAPEPENIFVDLYKSMSAFFPVAQTKGVRLNISISPDLPECLVYDSLRINQILTNLVSNAIKFTPSGGQVKISVALISQQDQSAIVQFSVKDTGIGIAKNKQSEVFESFKQAASDTAKQYGGTGLGLSIANRLVAQMGGDRIQLESEMHKGSRFFFELPIDVCRPKNSIRTMFSALKVGILTMPEEAPLMMSVGKYLRAFGINFVLFESAEDAGKCDILLVLSEKILCQQPSNWHQGIWSILFFKPKQKPLIEGNMVVLDQYDQNPSGLYNALLDFVMVDKKSSTDQTPALFKGRLLLAEDHAVNQKLMDAILRKLSVAYDLAENGVQAVQMFKQHAYDLVLLDINMPEMSGEEALLEMRKFEMEAHKSAKPIYALTANVLPEDIARFQSVGFDGHLGKPLSIDRLKEVLIRHSTRAI